MNLSQTTIPSISVDENHNSIFTEIQHQLNSHGDLWITEQQNALNFRHRKSPPNYQSDWHVAGDPTLITICTGTLEIELRDGTTKQFSAGQSFIAQDYLPPNIPFDNTKHAATPPSPPSTSNYQNKNKIRKNNSSITPIY